MPDALPILRRTLDFIQRPVLFVASLLIFVMMLHVVLDVLSKYLLNQPVTGTLEIVANYYMVAIVFLPLAVVQRQNGHVKVEVFTTALPQRVIAAFDVFAAVLTLIYVSLMTWFVLLEAIDQTAIREKLQIGIALMPVWPARWFAPIGAVLFILAIIMTLGVSVQRLRGIEVEDKRDEVDEWTA